MTSSLIALDGISQSSMWKYGGIKDVFIAQTDNYTHTTVCAYTWVTMTQGHFRLLKLHCKTG